MHMALPSKQDAVDSRRCKKKTAGMSGLVGLIDGHSPTRSGVKPKALLSYSSCVCTVTKHIPDLGLDGYQTRRWHPLSAHVRSMLYGFASLFLTSNSHPS